MDGQKPCDEETRHESASRFKIPPILYPILDFYWPVIVGILITFLGMIGCTDLERCPKEDGPKEEINYFFYTKPRPGLKRNRSIIAKNAEEFRSMQGAFDAIT